MSRAQEIRFKALNYSEVTDLQLAPIDLAEEAFVAGAEWADAHPDIDVRTMAAYQSGYKEAIEKACEWLYEYNRKQSDKMFGTVHTADVTINVAQFRKDMKGGEK